MFQRSLVSLNLISLEVDSIESNKKKPGARGCQGGGGPRLGCAAPEDLSEHLLVLDGCQVKFTEI